MYSDITGYAPEWVENLVAGVVVTVIIVAAVVITVALLAIADVSGVPGAGDVLYGVKDTIYQIGQSIQIQLIK